METCKSKQARKELFPILLSHLLVLQCPHHLLPLLLLSSMRSKTVNYSSTVEWNAFQSQGCWESPLRGAKGEGPTVGSTSSVLNLPTAHFLPDFCLMRFACLTVPQREPSISVTTWSVAVGSRAAVAQEPWLSLPVGAGSLHF